ncbi:MAG TPA: 50S ribosomal protein L15 [Candidatus Woesebacteria bacterium]|nr:50S ribosomal protein L15 [Candidatus Woesebacteria bacterium]
MLLSNLPKSTKTSKKRLGRGYGSGVGGHTVGRGQKGQKTRGTMPLWFEGGQLPIVRRTPFIKGKHRFQVIKLQPIVVNFDILSKYFEDKAIVDATALIKILKISDKEAKRGFKIVQTGKLEKALEINVLATAGAIKAIEKAGGKYTFSK